ncbi:MAG: hypothetical protein ACOH18_05440 [Candidatus Saccharimonadaceae bacterium]
MANKQLLPSNVLSDGDLELLESAGQMIIEGVALKEMPSKLRLQLVEIQAMRFEIGRRFNIYKGLTRDMAGVKFRTLKANMSQNAASKEVEFDEEVIKYKNTRDLFETAYEVMEAFVNTNQTSLRLAAEEAKNNL